MSCQHVLPGALPIGDTVVVSQHLHLDPLPSLVGRARDFVLTSAPPLRSDTCDILVLLTSELVTNAVVHARTTLDLGVTVTAGSVLVTVHDRGPTSAATPSDPAREGGWGLALVSALAQASGLKPHAEGGKTAWFRLSRDAPPAIWDSGSAQRSGSAADRDA